MRLLFPGHPVTPGKLDHGFDTEAGHATAAQLTFGILNGPPFEARKIVDGSGKVLYRGWLLRETEYRQVHEALKARGCELFTRPEAYEHTVRFPEWYLALPEGSTPRSIWFPWEASDLSETRLTSLINNLRDFFGDQSFIVKDYVKSRKHEWHDACFIQHVQDARRVISNFIERQGNDLVQGLVFREFVNLKRAGVHPKSGMPLAREWRIFVFNQKPFYIMPYWAVGDYTQGDQPSLDAVTPALGNIKSPFYAVDVAEIESGSELAKTTIVEVNDGGSAGIEEERGSEFYQALSAQLQSEGM